MWRFRGLLSRMAGTFRARSDQEFDQEMEEHLALLAERFQRQGMSAADAMSAARRQFGNLTGLAEQQHESRGIPLIETIRRDLQFGLRQFRKRPGFAVLAMAILALGIGANTAIFSVVNGVLLRPLPFGHPERLVALFENDVIDNSDPYNPVAPANFLDWQREATTFEEIAATSLTSSNFAGSSKEGSAERVNVCAASANLFDTLGAAPALGRPFSVEEDRPAGLPVAVISYGLWQRRFGGSADVLSQQIRLDGKLFTVVGVMPASFGYPSRLVQVWIPLQQHLSPVVLESHDNHVLSSTIGRLRPGATVDQARTEIDSIVKRYKHQHPAEVMGKGANVVSLAAFTLRDIRGSLLLLFAAVGCVLLIACVNVANLLLTRALGRKREIAIRAAIGASRGRIVRQLLMESLALSMLGAGVGFLVAWSLTGYLAGNIPGGAWLPQSTQVSVDIRVFLFSIALALVTGLASGIVPALQISREDLANDLKNVSRTNTAGRQQNRFRDVLVASEVALSLVLLTGAGLLMRSFEQLLSKDLGLRTSNTLVMTVSLPDAKYHERAQVSAFLKDLQNRLQAIRGVADVGFSNCPLVSLPGYCPDTVFRIEGHPMPPGHMMDAEYRQVSPGFFRSAGMPLVAGRTFTERDGIGLDDQHPRPGQAIVNENFARRFLPSEVALGKQIELYWFVGNSRTQTLLKYEIVGVTRDALDRPDAGARPVFYLPMFDGDSGDVNIVLHTAGAGASIPAQARAAIHQLDSDLAVFGVHTVNEVVGETIQDRRHVAGLFGAFAILAIVLATVGLYGVVSSGVVQRRNEIAVRMAIGAGTGDVLRMVLLSGLRPAIAGVFAGIPCALAAGRFFRTLLFEIHPADPVTLAAVVLMLLACASLASIVPARRAARIDPTIGLRAE